MKRIPQIIGCFTLGGLAVHHLAPPPLAAAEATPVFTHHLTAQDSGTDDAKVTTPQRVVLQTAPERFVHGTVEQETDSIITVADDAGKIETFIKSRLLRLTYLVEPAEDQKGIVFLRDGSRREATIVADDYEGVVIESGGVRSRLNRAIVDRVELIPTVHERYVELKRTIGRDQFDQRFAMCHWLIDEGEFELALQELEALQVDQPRFPGLQPVMRQVRAQVALLEDRPVEPGSVGERSDGGGTGTGPVDHADTLPQEILTHEDVNLMRVYEIDFRNPPEVNVTADTIRELITRYSSHESIPASAEGRAAIFRMEPVDVVRLMFEVRARDLYDQIEVLTEPYAMNLFHHRVHNTWLVKNCATSRCHGGVDAGRLFLHSRNYRDPRVRYTNFLILERLQIPDRPPLLNYDAPTDSLIYQYALPVTEARFPHPQVPGWKPALGPAQRSMREDFTKWLRAMYPTRPDYPIDYTPPALIVDESTGGSGGDRRDR